MVPLVSAGAAYDMEGDKGKEEDDSDEEVLELEKQEDQRRGFMRRSNCAGAFPEWNNSGRELV